MEIILGIILIIIGRKIYNWYGYQKGIENPIYWKPAHENRKLFFIINFVILSFSLSGIGLIIYFLVKMIY
jgi:hypothetical protein